MTEPRTPAPRPLPLQPNLPRSERPVLHLPGDARLAFWVAPNIEFYELDPPANPMRASWPRPVPDILNYSRRDYGNRVGVWRCLEVFDRHDIVGSVSLNAAMCSHLPEVVGEFVRRGWELFYHGHYNTQYLFGYSPDEERSAIQTSCMLIEKFAEQRVRGFLAPALTYNETSFESAAAAGIEYVFDLFREDAPFPLDPGCGRLISIPYHVEINDFHALVQQGMSPKQYLALFKDHFRRLYEEGSVSAKVVGLPLHPYVIGTPHYIDTLDEMLGFVRSHQDVWITRATDIADWYYANYYDETVRRLHSAPEAGRHE